MAILPPGAVIDPDIFRREVEALHLDRHRVVVSPYATVISAEDKESEQTAGLIAQIGSTGSGTGAALIRRICRQRNTILAGEHPDLKAYLADTSSIMRDTLHKNRRIVIEGSQGFGLSLLHGGYYPKATSRDTTAATFLGEAGLSPFDVDDITLVLRAHPIRVAGDSGLLEGETTWAEIAKTAGLPEDYCERTTATKKIRRVGMFEPILVRRAIDANKPTRIVLNHFDYVDKEVRFQVFNRRAIEFLENIENSIGKKVELVGISPSGFVPRDKIESIDQSPDFKVVAPPRTNHCLDACS